MADPKSDSSPVPKSHFNPDPNPDSSAIDLGTEPEPDPKPDPSAIDRGTDPKPDPKPDPSPDSKPGPSTNPSAGGQPRRTGAGRHHMRSDCHR